MAETNTRQASRAPVTLKIKFKSETLDQFIERYSVDISHGGIFIRTKDPLAVGTTLKFEFQLKDATPLITGDGTVVWTREPDAKRAGVSPGMGVRFDKLPNESQKVLDAVLAKKGGKLSSVVEPLEDDDDDDDAAGDFVDSPTRVAPAGLVDSLVSAKDYDDGDLTPLPKPMPFHGDVDDFSDDAFNESTKVASLDQILAQAKGSAETDESAYDEDAVFASTSGPIPIPKVEPEKAAAPAHDYEDPFADLNDAEDEESASTPAASTSADTKAATGVLATSASSNVITSTAESDDDEDPDESSVEDAQVDGFDDADDTAEPDDTTDSDEEDDDDEELDDDDDGINPHADDAKVKSEPSQTSAARAAVLEPAGEDERGSSMPWIAVAAVILLIGGVGGFWLLNKGDKDEQPAAAAKSTVPALSDPSRLPDTTAQDPEKDTEIVEPPAALTRPVTITTVPEGARLTVEGTELQAISPATFDLEAGKAHTVHVQHDAFLSQSIEVGADSSEVEPITLAAKPKILRISSQPPGAIVLVNGQRLRGRTPVDLPVTTRMAGMPSVRVQLRLPGYQAVDARVPMSEGFEPAETQLISSFTAQLKQFAARPNPSQDTKPDGVESGTTSEPADTGDETTDKSNATPTKTEPAKTEPKKTEPKKTEPKKTEPAKTEPAKTEPAKTEPAKTEPVKKPDTKTDSKPSEPSEPTPDWMK